MKDEEMEIAYRDDAITIAQRAFGIRVKLIRQGVYQIDVPQRGGQFSIELIRPSRSSRPSPNVLIVDGLKAGLSPSEFAPKSNYSLMAERNGGATWFLLRNDDTQGQSFSYGYTSEAYWLDVRGFIHSTAGVSADDVTDWIQNGIVVAT